MFQVCAGGFSQKFKGEGWRSLKLRSWRSFRVLSEFFFFFNRTTLFIFNCKEMAATLPLQRENLPTPAGLCGQAWEEPRGPHRTSVSVIGRLELQRCGGRQRLTSSAETQWRWSSDYMSHHALGLSRGRWGEPLVQEALSNWIKRNCDYHKGGWININLLYKIFQLNTN